MTHHLILSIPDSEPIQYALNASRIGVGRGPDNQIQVTTKGVSFSHMEIFIDGDTCTIRDLGSFNGTFINGEVLKNEEKIIEDGDRILLGEAAAFHYIVLASLEEDAEESVWELQGSKGMLAWQLDEKVKNLEEQRTILSSQLNKELETFHLLLQQNEYLLDLLRLAEQSSGMDSNKFEKDLEERILGAKQFFEARGMDWDGEFRVQQNPERETPDE